MSKTQLLLTTYTGELMPDVEFFILANKQTVLNCVGIDRQTAGQIVRRERHDINVDIRHWLSSERQRQVRR